MSTSPPSTALRTPSSTPAPEPLSSTGRTGRVRKPIERFGSIVRTDQLYGDGDESDTGTAVEDEDGDFAGLGGESSEDEIGGQDYDDDEEDDKKRKVGQSLSCLPSRRSVSTEIFMLLGGSGRDGG